MWGGVVACFAMMVVMGLGARWDAGWARMGQPPGNANAYVIGMEGGVLMAGWGKITSLDDDLALRARPLFMAQRRLEPVRWLPASLPAVYPLASFGFLLPLWIPIVLTAIPTGLLVRAERRERRRMRAHLCAKCGYDRRGLVDGAVCPECGDPLRRNSEQRESGESSRG